VLALGILVRRKVLVLPSVRRSDSKAPRATVNITRRTGHMSDTLTHGVQRQRQTNRRLHTHTHRARRSRLHILGSFLLP